MKLLKSKKFWIAAVCVLLAAGLVLGLVLGLRPSADTETPSVTVRMAESAVVGQPFEGFSQDLIILPRPTSVSQPPKSWDLEYTPLYLSIHSFSVVLSPSTHPEGMMGFL